MYDPSMRVLTVLEVLQARERVSGADLARHLEVSPRTVQRYIARLQDLGIPVESTRGVGGAYRLRPGYRLPPLMFTDDEALALALGLRALTHIGLTAFAPAAHAAHTKLGRVLPRATRDHLDAVEQSVALDAVPWTVHVDARTLALIASATRARRTVTITYEAPSGPAGARRIDPYGLVHLNGRWYVVGHCHLRDALRSFRLDRLRTPTVHDQHFERPANFDARAYLYATLPFVPSAHEVDLWLALPPDEAQYHFAPWRATLTAHDGGTRVQCTREHLQPFAALLLGLGCEVRVHRPSELQEAFRHLARHAAALADAPPAAF